MLRERCGLCDGLEFCFSGLLSRCSMRGTGKRDIPRLPAELRAVTGTRLLELQRGLRRWHRAFIWDAEYGAAYATVLHALRRAANLTA